MHKNLTFVLGLQMHNKVNSHMITGQKPQFFTTPLLFIFFRVKSVFLTIKEINPMIIVYKTSIKKVFLKNIIIYFIVPKRVSIEDPSLVQKMSPNTMFNKFVVINAEDISLHN